MRLARPQRLSLRARLLWTFLVPLTLVLVLVGVVSTAKLRDQLVGQVDTRLDAALSRSSHAAGDYGPPFALPGAGGSATDDGPGGPDFLGARGQAAGTLGALVVGGHVESGGSGVNTEGGEVQQLTATQNAIVARIPSDGQART